jgi:hypothetical protein
MFQGKSPIVGLFDEQYWSMFETGTASFFKFVQSCATASSIISLALLYRLSLIVLPNLMPPANPNNILPLEPLICNKLLLNREF